MHACMFTFIHILTCGHAFYSHVHVRDYFLVQGMADTKRVPGPTYYAPRLGMVDTKDVYAKTNLKSSIRFSLCATHIKLMPGQTMHPYAHVPLRWNANEGELISRGYVLTMLACDDTHRYSFGRAELPWQKKTTRIPGSVAEIRRATDRQVCLHSRSFTCVRASAECVVVPVSGAQTS